MTYKFEAIIKEIPEKNGAYIEIPFDVQKEFGSKIVKVKAKFDGIDYRGSIVSMGDGIYIIGILKSIRIEINKEAGDKIFVEIEKDEDVREVELPLDFKTELEQNEEALKFYNGLSYSAKKKYYQWIISAKKEETRQKRITEAVSKLESNIKI